MRRTRLFALLVALVPRPAATLEAQTRVMPSDYGRWEEPGNATLSSDGRWIAVPITRIDMDGELQIQALTGETEPRVVMNAVNPRFSEDGRWLAYTITPGEAEREAQQRAGQPSRSRLGLLELETGRQTEVPDVANHAFGAHGRFIAMRGYSASGESTFDVVIRDLATGEDTPLGNVTAFEWQADGPLMALAVDAGSDQGDGIQLYDAATGRLRMLETDTATFSHLTWHGEDLAVLRARHDAGREGPTHIVMVWRDLAGDGSRRVFDPATARGFPADTRIVDARPLEWSQDGQRLFFGVKAWQPAADSAAGSDTPRADVDVWHWQDARLIPEQRLWAARDATRNDLAVWHLEEDRFVRLDDGTFEEVTLFDDGRQALGYDETPWARERAFGAQLRDLYRIDAATGARQRVKAGIEHDEGASPGGHYILYLEDDHYRVYDIERGTHTNITANVPVPFVNQAHDHAVEQAPPFGSAGWTEDDESVLLYSRYDVWEVTPDGARYERLTHGADAGVTSRLVWLTPDHRLRDLEGDEFVALYGVRSRMRGYGRLRRDGVDTLVWEDRSVLRFQKAAAADVYAWRAESFDDSPDWFVSARPFGAPRQVTRTNPFQANYAWGRAELLDFQSANGTNLQAALLYPADYVPGRQYPLIVYIYESTSQALHEYHAPSEKEAYNPTVWTQAGYFVLRPDIAYRLRDPGHSAVESLVPAVRRAIETGMIDAQRVGLIGESWGGYQTAFVPTQTDLFAAAVAGAPITDMVSMHLSVFRSLGIADARIIETGQGRMEVTPWEDRDAYIRNSTVHHIESLNTPLLIAFGEQDGSVDWNQGIYLYNAARRTEKNVVLLAYPGEGHSLAREANRVDFHNRILEWFGHYLKGEPAAAWITEGVPFLARDREFRPSRGGTRR